MPPLFRTLGPVAPPVNPQDIANKGYVDNISPDVLTYFRLSDLQITGAGTGNLYSAYGDFGLGNLGSGGTNNRFSRGPFPMIVVRFGLMYQPASIAAYNNFISQNYVMQLIRYNPSGSDPPAVVLQTGTLLPGQKYLDNSLGSVGIGTGNTDVYTWSVQTAGTATNIGSINLNLWYEFRPTGSTEIESGAFQKELDEQDKIATEKTKELLKKDPDYFKKLNIDFDSVDDRINDTHNKRESKKTN